MFAKCSDEGSGCRCDYIMHALALGRDHIRLNSAQLNWPVGLSWFESDRKSDHSASGAVITLTTRLSSTRLKLTKESKFWPVGQCSICLGVGGRRGVRPPLQSTWPPFAGQKTAKGGRYPEKNIREGFRKLPPLGSRGLILAQRERGKICASGF